MRAQRHMTHAVRPGTVTTQAPQTSADPCHTQHSIQHSNQDSAQLHTYHIQGSHKPDANKYVHSTSRHISEPLHGPGCTTHTACTPGEWRGSPGVYQYTICSRVNVTRINARTNTYSESPRRPTTQKMLMSSDSVHGSQLISPPIKDLFSHHTTFRVLENVKRKM